MTEPVRTLIFLLQGNAGGDASGSLLSMLPMLLIFFVIFYFILIRPQQRERKVQEAMRTSLKKGDEVLTQGGILAKVQQVKDQYIVLDLDGSARIRVVKESIVRRIGEPADAAKDAKPAKDEKEEAAN